MKQGRKPQYMERIKMSNKGLNYKEWEVITETGDTFTIRHRVSKEVKVMNK